MADRTPWTHRPLRTLADRPKAERARASFVHGRRPGRSDPEAFIGTCPGCRNPRRRADEMVDLTRHPELQDAFPGLDFVCTVCIQHADRLGRLP